MQACVNALVGIEIVLGCQVKSVVFSELSDIETESLRDNIMQDAMDVLFAIAFIGGISLNFTTLSTLTVLFFLKVFHYMCDFRQESVCCPLPSCTHFFFWLLLLYLEQTLIGCVCARVGDGWGGNNKTTDRCSRTSTLTGG